MFTRALALATIALSQSALAQCDEWLPTAGSSSIGPAHHMCTVDHDGPGPKPATLYASGTLPGPAPVNAALAWDGARWTAIAAFPSSPTALYPIDEPTAGVPAGTLLVGSSISSGPLGATRFLCAWDGQSISSIGSTDMAAFSSGATVRAITTWDPDGPGPQQPLIIVGGTFTRIGGVNANNIAAWNGSQWLPLAQGRPTPVTALISFDADGPGPALPLLVTNSGRWNGTAWEDGGISGTTNRFAVHDADGDGPLLPELYAAGNFSPDILARPPVFRWTGSTWNEAGTGLATRTTAYDLRSIDFDGPGGQPPQLVLAGSHGNSPVAILQNGAWVGLPSIPNASGPNGRSIIFADPDADGPRTNELIIAGSLTLLPSSALFQFNGPVTWNGQRWSPLGSEFIGGIVYDFAWNDDDGDGPNPPQLYAGGSFRFAGGQPADGLARWDGARWIGLGTPAAEGRTAFRLDSFDPDGSGPQPPWLVAINSSISASMTTMRWNGTAWTYVDQFYSGLQTMALRAFDSDGPGPAPARLFVGGRDIRTQTTPSGTIGTFSTGPRFSITNINNYFAYTLFPHDTDGPGPLAPRLHAFLSNSVEVFIYQSDGSTWNLSARAPFNNENYIPDALSWDPDGDGPALPAIVVGASRIYGWGPSILEGTTSRQLGYNATEPTVVRRLGSFDPDGPGPAQPQLLMGYGRGNGKGIKRLIGAEWTDMGTGLFNFASGGDPLLNYAASFITIDPDNDGPLPPELWIGGSFTHANDQPAACFARWRLTGALPVITQQPESQTPCSNTPTTLTVAADNAQTHQWRISDTNSPLRWRALADGPIFIAGRYIGIAQNSQSSSFTFIPAAEIATSFTCIVSSPCGAVITSPASLSTIATCCGSADFNHDGDPGSDLDIEAFFACLAGRCCQTCDSIDFNADGDYATDADIEAFFRVLAGGNC